MRIDLLFFGGGQPADLAVIAFLAIASTVFVHCNLLRRPWFLAFLAVIFVAHLGLIIAFPGTDLDSSEFRLFTSTDVLAVIGLAFGLEKLVSLRTLTRACRPLPIPSSATHALPMRRRTSARKVSAFHPLRT